VHKSQNFKFLPRLALPRLVLPRIGSHGHALPQVKWQVSFSLLGQFVKRRNQQKHFIASLHNLLQTMPSCMAASHSTYRMPLATFRLAIYAQLSALGSWFSRMLEKCSGCCRIHNSLSV